MLDPASLTVHPQKLQAFQQDPYFRDAWEGFEKTSNARLLHLLYDCAPVILRPDALVSGHYRTIVSALLAEGLEIVFASDFRYSRATVRECWRYQLNIATRERIDVMDMILVGLPAAYVVFRRVVTEAQPLCSKISSLKGPSDPSQRKPWHLRYSRQAAQESVLTFLHVPDEPLDMAREMGAFFGPAERLAILRRAGCSQINDQGVAKLDAIAATYPTHTLRTVDSWNRILAQPDAATAASAAAAHRLWRESPGAWRRVLGLLQALQSKPSHWDRVSIAAASASTHIPGGQPILADTLQDWPGTVDV